MSEGVISAKSIRQGHSGLEQIQSKQLQLAALLHRIYYKGKAQHRRAKWFQSIDGLRKCFSKLLQMDRVKAKMEDSLPDRGVHAKGRNQRRKEKDGEGDDIKEASLEAAKRAIGAVWSSLWGDEPVKQDGSLAKYDRPPLHDPDLALSLLAAQKLLIVCLQLQELVHRARLSFNLMQIHLRTPPAPTFAPLVLSLLSLCAQIHSACVDALWADGEKSTGMAHIYAHFRMMDNTKVASNTLTLDFRRLTNKKAFDKILLQLQARGKSGLDWMPRKLIRAEKEPGQLQMDDLSGKGDESIIQATSPTQGLDDEDIGEAV